MPMFEERERAFEAKFAHEQEARFLETARRDKLFALRIAGRLHFPPHESGELTAAAIAIADGPGHDSKMLDLMAKVLTEHGQRADPAELTAVLEECGKQALAGAPPSA